MHLIQFLLPLYDNEGQPFKRNLFESVRNELTEAFGGVTAYLRSPAEGAWQAEGGAVNKDDVVIYEVLTPTLDRAWWKEYGEELAQRFRQKEMMIRAIRVERL